MHDNAEDTETINIYMNRLCSEKLRYTHTKSD